MDSDDDLQDVVGSVNIKDLVSDFATEEFVQKNVRVRPASTASLHQNK